MNAYVVESLDTVRICLDVDTSESPFNRFSSFLGRHGNNKGTEYVVRKDIPTCTRTVVTQNELYEMNLMAALGR